MQEILDRTLEQDVAEMETLIVELGWVGRRRMEQELDAFSLTVPQYMALRCLFEHPQGCSMTGLAESSQQVPATMTGVIDRLEERGLVRREPDITDRRAQRVILTPGGRELLEQISAKKREWVRQFLSGISVDDRQAMISLSARYLEAFKNTLSSK